MEESPNLCWLLVGVKMIVFAGFDDSVIICVGACSY